MTPAEDREHSRNNAREKLRNTVGIVNSTAVGSYFPPLFRACLQKFPPETIGVLYIVSMGSRGFPFSPGGDMISYAPPMSLGSTQCCWMPEL